MLIFSSICSQTLKLLQGELRKIKVDLDEAPGQLYDDLINDAEDIAEVLPLIGSNEGIGHIAFCVIDPGDIALLSVWHSLMI